VRLRASEGVFDVASLEPATNHPCGRHLGITEIIVHMAPQGAWLARPTPFEPKSGPAEQVGHDVYDVEALQPAFRFGSGEMPHGTAYTTADATVDKYPATVAQVLSSRICQLMLSIAGI
jgi:hypothetical protein